MNKEHHFLSSAKKDIVSFISNRKEVSKAELLEHFSLTSTSLTRMLQELLAQRVIVAAGLGTSSGGRKPILYELNASYCYFIGIEISRFYTTVGLFDFKLNLVAVTRWHMDSSMQPKIYLEHVKRNLLAFCRDHQISLEEVAGAGIGAVGPLNRAEGTILNPKHYVAKGWSQLGIISLVEEQLGMRAVLDNGADCAILGEQHALRLQQLEAEHMLYIHAGMGLRSAMISGGRVVQGLYDREGAFGQMIIMAGQQALLPDCKPGSLENYVSISALVEQVKIQYRLGRGLLSESYQEHEIDFNVLMKELHRENQSIIELFEQSAAYLGIGIANLINTFQPKQVILGGALMNAYKPYAKLVEQTANRYTYNFTEYQAQFSQGILMENAVATGAALLMRQKILNELKG